jgi:antitoxin (DNA-binding transcriptional repressor) of toxin-antitoxin stability system
MSTATVDDLHTHFDELSAKLAAGEIIHLWQNGKPWAKLVPETTQPGPSILGAAKGLAQFGDDFDEPLDLEWDACK